MYSKSLFIVFFLFCFNKDVFSQKKITGNWRRVMPVLKYVDSIVKQNHYGDIEIRKDSTFKVHGDTANNNSNIQAWHIGNEYSGTWQLQKGNYRVLYLNPKEDRLVLSYKIIKLGKQKLILLSSLDKNNNHKIKYFRFL
jgi:mRNA-degrading endonuclease RelE of RelBE toxin-antitoxin system